MRYIHDQCRPGYSALLHTFFILIAGHCQLVGGAENDTQVVLKLHDTPGSLVATSRHSIYVLDPVSLVPGSNWCYGVLKELAYDRPKIKADRVIWRGVCVYNVNTESAQWWLLDNSLLNCVIDVVPVASPVSSSILVSVATKERRAGSIGVVYDLSPQARALVKIGPTRPVGQLYAALFESDYVLHWGESATSQFGLSVRGNNDRQLIPLPAHWCDLVQDVPGDMIHHSTMSFSAGVSTDDIVIGNQRPRLCLKTALS